MRHDVIIKILFQNNPMIKIKDNYKLQKGTYSFSGITYRVDKAKIVQIDRMILTYPN